jgi:hypothetical protein
MTVGAVVDIAVGVADCDDTVVGVGTAAAAAAVVVVVAVVRMDEEKTLDSNAVLAASVETNLGKAVVASHSYCWWCRGLEKC